MSEQERTYQESPGDRLPIGLPVIGTASLAVTSGRTLYVNAQSNGANDPSVGLTVRGVRYLVSAHLEKSPSGTWDYAGHTEYEKRTYFYITRADSRKHDAVSESARNVLSEAILVAVRQWAKEHQPLLLAGEVRALNNQIMRLAEKLAEAEAAAAALRTELEALQAQERIALSEDAG